MEKEEFIFIQDQIGYQFKNLDLLQQAFVRRSYSQENGGEDNEVLEFIGDRALDIVVVKYLADTYGGFAREYEDFDADDDYDEFHCAYDESGLSKIKQSLVCRKNLAKCIEKLELEEFLIMGESDVQQQIWKQDSVKEDLFEAIVGAVTLDSQWNFDQIEDAVKIMLGDTLSDFSDEETNYVNEVQQWCLWKNESMPLYHYEGPGKSVRHLWYTGFPGIILPFSDQDYRVHDGIRIAPDFYCMVNLRDKSLPLFCACGYSKSDARHRACAGIYAYLKEHGPLPTIKDEIDDPNRSESISQLEILVRRGHFDFPEYFFEETYDENGNPIWECTCIIPDHDWKTKGISSKKKEAKKDAAFAALKRVLSES